MGAPDGLYAQPAPYRLLRLYSTNCLCSLHSIDAGDVYGPNPKLPAVREAHGVGYVLAVASDHRMGFGGATRSHAASAGDHDLRLEY
jgi:hypothetical protein